MLEENSEFAGNYTTEERAAFENYLNGQLAKIKIDNPDMPFLRNVMLKMYANPLKNHLEAVKG
jgi:predicted aldo/keto reductase-like oxidoreductase